MIILCILFGNNLISFFSLLLDFSSSNLYPYLSALVNLLIQVANLENIIFYFSSFLFNTYCHTLPHTYIHTIHAYLIT